MLDPSKLIVRSWLRKDVFQAFSQISKIVFRVLSRFSVFISVHARQLALLPCVTTKLWSWGKAVLPVLVGTGRRIGLHVLLKSRWTVCIHDQTVVFPCVRRAESVLEANRGRSVGGGKKGGGWKGWNFRFLWQYWIAGQECTPRLGWEELGDLK